MSERDALLHAFLEREGWGAAVRRLLATDASFRSYDRLTLKDATAVLMDAPPPQEDVRSFRRIAEGLGALGLAAPKVLAADEEVGFLLLEDFGDETFTKALAKGADEAALYELATDTLITLHERWSPETGPEAPPYDIDELMREAFLLTDWYFPAASGEQVPVAQRAGYEAAWREALAVLESGLPETLVLRDYHVDNLMILSDGRCGLLDFQDALIGSPAYDLASLLKDVRRDVSPAVEAACLTRYLARLPKAKHEAFRTAYALLGAQRNAKIIGIFTRLDRRDLKPHYLQHIARTWTLLDADLAHPALAPVKAWFDEILPPARRVTPEASR